MSELTVSDCDTVYETVLRAVLRDGDRVAAGQSLSVGSNRATRELTNLTVVISDLRDRLITNTRRPLDIGLAIARFVWMISGSNRVSDIAFYDERATRFSDDGTSIPGSDFGRRIFKALPGIDQLQGAVDRLRADPSTRRAAMAIYQPEDSVRESRDIPCLFGVFYRLRHATLETTVIMRSNNALSLLPFNLFELTLLSEVVAAGLGVGTGVFSYIAVSMHLYEDDLDTANEVAGAGPGLSVELRRMPQMPSEPSPLVQARHTVALEREARGVSLADLDELMRKACSLLVPYWQQLFFVLLHRVCLIRAGDVASEHRIKERIGEPFRSVLRLRPMV
jgi:thymidylate synthase